MHEPFKKGNTLSVGHGRPKGARNKLANCVFQDVLEFWNEPAADGSELTKGRESLLTMWREKPNEFVKSVFSIMPKELLFDNVATSLSDDELDRMIELLRERALSARQQDALELQPEPPGLLNGQH